MTDIPTIDRTDIVAELLSTADAYTFGLGGNISVIDRAAAEITRLRSELSARDRSIDELEGALKPFAEEASAFGVIWPDHTAVAAEQSGACCGVCGENPGYAKAAFTVGDLRNARAVLSQSKGDGT